MNLAFLYSGSKILKSILSDGVGEYFSTPNANIAQSIITNNGIATPKFTIHFFFKPLADAAAHSSIFGLGSRFYCWSVRDKQTTPRILFQFTTVAGTRSLFSNLNSIVLNSWNCVSIVINGANSKVYINGVDQTLSNGILDADTVLADLVSDWTLFTYGSQTYDEKCNLVQFALMSAQMTLAEHQQIYNNGCPLKVSDVIESDKIATLIEDNYSWDGTKIVVSRDGWQSVNMEEADITTTTPC